MRSKTSLKKLPFFLTATLQIYRTWYNNSNLLVKEKTIYLTGLIVFPNCVSYPEAMLFLRNENFILC